MRPLILLLGASAGSVALSERDLFRSGAESEMGDSLGAR